MSIYRDTLITITPNTIRIHSSVVRLFAFVVLTVLAGVAMNSLLSAPLPTPQKVIGPAATCGNDVCDATENSNTCPEDCPIGLCGDDVCQSNEDELICPEDCITFTCGNDICEAGENSGSCPQDCRPVDGGNCGDGICTSPEDSTNCAIDCRPIVNCGDGRCEGSETSETCAADCSATSGGICGDGVCSSPEDPANCAADCRPIVNCGDGRCEGSETRETCAADCSAGGGGFCGDGVCAAPETGASCSADCRPSTATRTPTALPTGAVNPNTETDVSTKNTTVDRSATVTPLIINVPESPEEVINPANEILQIDALPPNCKLMSLSALDLPVSTPIEALTTDMVVLSELILVCDQSPDEICVPYTGEIDSASEVQIIDCDITGICRVHQANTINSNHAVCITQRFGRPMPLCDGACAAARGLDVTITDLSGYVMPFSISLSALVLGSAGFAFMVVRPRNRELITESDESEEGLVTRVRVVEGADDASTIRVDALPRTITQQHLTSENDNPDTLYMDHD